MKEFMLLIRNQPASKTALPEAEHNEFLKECEHYIADLKAQQLLIAAQPMVREGHMVTLTDSGWKTSDYQEGEEVIVGYYHIVALDLDHAAELAKGNPEFRYSTTARIEVRPLKSKEVSTGFVYPERVKG